MNLSAVSASALRPIAAAHIVYLLLFGAAMLFWLRWRGVETGAATAIVCLLPVLAATALLFTSTEDQTQYLLRLLACAMFAPLLLLFWSASAEPAELAAPRLVWPGATLAALIHVAAFVGAILWMGTATTRVAAASGSVESADVLRARLLSLNGMGAPFDAASGSPEEVVVRYRYREDAGLSHVAILRLDAERREVSVRERLSAKAARPDDGAGGASTGILGDPSMRGPADPYFDPKRPKASMVSGTVAQTTIVKPERLAALSIHMTAGLVQLPEGQAALLDGEGMVTLLCAVVTRSGWTWQPVFFEGN